MANLHFGELLSILQSPKGVLSVTLAISSFAALIYILLTKSASSSSKSKSKKMASKQSSPAKQFSSSSKTPPAKKATSNSTKRETPKSVSASKIKTSNDKSDAKAGLVKISSAKTRQKIQANGSQKLSQKDEGEWITVSKKKPRASKKATSPEQPSAPKTRSSTRLGSQGASGI